MARWHFPYETHSLEIDLLAQLREVMDPDYEPEFTDDPQFFNTDVAAIAESARLLEFGILPEAGGWLDQDSRWVHDVALYRQAENRVMWERMQSEKRDDQNDPTDALFSGEADEGGIDLGTWAGG